MPSLLSANGREYGNFLHRCITPPPPAGPRHVVQLKALCRWMVWVHDAMDFDSHHIFWFLYILTPDTPRWRPDINPLTPSSQQQIAEHCSQYLQETALMVPTELPSTRTSALQTVHTRRTTWILPIESHWLIEVRGVEWNKYRACYINGCQSK